MIAGQYGQLGHDDLIRRSTPNHITSVSDKIFCQVSAGKKHTAALNELGHVYIWGSNEFGQLGIKVIGSSHHKQQSQIVNEGNLSSIKYGTKSFISQNNSPKEIQHSNKTLDLDVKSFPVSSNNNLTFAESSLNIISTVPSINIIENFKGN